eukprot:gene19347-13993_t
MKDKLSSLLDTIVQQVTERELTPPLSSGDRGELASTVYLLHGYETATRQAIQQQRPDSAPQSRTFSGLLPLGDWIATFAGVPLTLRGTVPASVDTNADEADGNDRLTDMLSTCSVSFTGWTEAHEPVISEMLTYAYCHRVGFVCNGDEPAVHMVVPLVLGPAPHGASTTASSASAEAISETEHASVMEQMATGSTTGRPVLSDRSQKAPPAPMAAGVKRTPVASATETMDDPEGLDGTPRRCFP